MYDVCTQIIHIQHTRMICDYFWPSFCCKIRHDDHGLVKRFRPPFFLRFLFLCRSQNLEDWDGLLLGAVQIAPQARGVEPWFAVKPLVSVWSLAFGQPWCDPFLWPFSAHGLVILEKDLDSHLHIAQVFRLFQPISASSIGEPPLQYPFNFFTCRMAGQQCCAAAPSAPKRAWGLSCVVFLPYGIVMDRNYRIVR